MRKAVIIICYFVHKWRGQMLVLVSAPNEGSIPMKVGEELHIMEQDQGDGWTQVRHPTGGEMGFVPTSYIEVHLYDP